MNLYNIIKSLHIIFVISWYAGLFYIFRLFVYHVKFKTKPDCRSAYELMEEKLLNFIMKPAMILTFIFGFWMVYLNPAMLQAKWLYAKLLGVVLLIGYQVLSEITRKHFADGDFFLTEKTCRYLNEIPTLILFVAVFMVILKPF